MGNNHWTPNLVEERLVEAAAVLKRLPEEKVRGYFSAWPDVVLDANESFGWNDPVLRRPWPSPGSIDRMDETMQWLQWLDPDVAKICWFRAAGKRWKTI